MKAKVSKGISFIILFGAMACIGVFLIFPEPSAESTSHVLDKLEDSWVAESGRMTKDCKSLSHLSEMKLSILSLSHDQMIVYAQPASEIIPSSIILKLKKAENLIEGRVFHAIRQSDSVGFNMILSQKSNKLTLAFALDDGPASGEYVLSFLRDQVESPDLSSF